ncbi:MAG: magnesium transporter CorA family protein [Chloroflexi bacterium]|nr:magnesium transporter CorA family protein [Chloroflexota bacterium]
MTSSRTARRESAIQTITWKGLTWLNIEGPTMAEMGYLKEHYPFHPLALDDCLSKVQIPKVDEYEGYLFLVLHFPVFNRLARITQPSQVSIFAGADYIVTVQKGDLRPLVKLFQDCRQSEEVRDELMAHSSGYLLYRLLDVLVDYCFPIVNKIIENVDRVEEHLFERNPTKVVQEVSIVRRDIIAYRRIIRPQIAVMETLEEREYPILKVDPEVYFGDLADHTRRIWEELEELKEVIEGLNDTIFTLTTYTTNDVIRILTIVFTLGLPLTLVSSLYGMNMRLPLAGNPMTFWLVVLASLSFSGVMLLFFRLRRWL